MTELLSEQELESSSSSILSGTNDIRRIHRRSSSGNSSIVRRRMMTKREHHRQESKQSVSTKDLMLGGEKNATEIIRKNDDNNHNSHHSSNNSRPSRRRTAMSSISTSPSSLSSSFSSLSSTIATPTTIKARAIDSAETKIQNTIQAKKVKQRRRNDISKSLDSAMLAGDIQEENNNKIEAVQEGEESMALNDINEGEGRIRDSSQQHQRMRRRRQSPSVKRRNITRDQRQSMVKTRSISSLQVKGEEEERQRSSSIDGDDTDLNVTSPSQLEGLQTLEQVQKLKSTKVRSKSSIDGDDSEINTNETRSRQHRSKSQSRPRDARSRSRPRDARSVDPKRRLRLNRSGSRGPHAVRDRSKGPIGSRRSRSKPRPRSHDDDDDDDNDKSVASLMSTATSATAKRGRRPRQKTHRNVGDGSSDDNDYDNDHDHDKDDDDMKSVTSAKSIGSRMSSASGNAATHRRGQRPASSRHLSRKTPTNNETYHPDSSNSSFETGTDGENPLHSPVTDNPKCKKILAQSTSSLGNHFEVNPPLGRHLKSDKKKQEKDTLSIVEERSTESSRFSCMNSQPILLQFDPTNKNLVRTVDQTTAKKTSETIHQSDGTKSKFEISELDDLPTFEKPYSSCEFSESDIPTTESPGSMLSSNDDGGSSVEGGYGSKSSSFLSLVSKKPVSSKSSQSSQPSTPRQRGGLGNNLQEKKLAFMQRVQKGKADVAERLKKSQGIRLGGRGAHQALDDDDDSIGDSEPFIK